MLTRETEKGAGSTEHASRGERAYLGALSCLVVGDFSLETNNELL